MFDAAGAKVVAVQDHGGTVFAGGGLDIRALGAHVAHTGTVAGFAGGEAVGIDDFWAVECEFLVPAALEGQLQAERAARVRARVVLEAANGPTTPEADRILAERGIVVVPDVVANAGGVTVSYFEWVQDFSMFFWTEDEIDERLDRILTGAFRQVWETHEEMRLPLRTAAFVVACTRVLQARADRGLYP